MKKNIMRFIYISLSILVATALFSACSEKDKSCKVIVTVRDIADTSVRIPGATVNLSKGNSYIQAESVTDIKGEAFFTFANEAILDINVSYVDDNGNKRSGKSTVRLRQGETERKDVLLQWD